MTVPPVVRDFILCEDFVVDPLNPVKMSLVNLVYAIRSNETPAFPVIQPELCAFAALTNCHGSGRIEVRLIEADSGDEVRYWDIGRVEFGHDPLRVIGIPIRLRRLYSRTRVGIGSGLTSIKLRSLRKTCC